MFENDAVDTPGGRDDAVAERRAQQQSATRRGIMLAAARAVTTHGYAAATMRVIAKEAGFTASSLYTYFRSKEQLFEELRTEVEDEFLRVTEQDMPIGPAFSVRVTLLTHRLLHLTEQFSDAVVLHLSGVMPSSDAIQTRCAFETRTMQTLTNWFRHHSSPEERNHHRPEMVAVLFQGIMHAILKNALLRCSGAVDEAVLRPCDAQVTRFFLASLTADPGFSVEANATENARQA